LPPDKIIRCKATRNQRDEVKNIRVYQIANICGYCLRISKDRRGWGKIEPVKDVMPTKKA
jgi:hypothetical protein